MRIALLGFGNVGAQLGRLWSSRGHTLAVGLREGSKSSESAKALGATVSSPAEAVKGADVIVLALPWAAVEEALAEAGPLQGKIVLDATNPLRADLSVMVPEAGSGALQVAQWAGGARVVKAFNTIGAALFGDAAFDMFYCGDDAAANQVVHGLIAETTMRPVYAGPLTNAGYLEQLAGLWVDLAVKGRLQGAFGFKLVTK